MHRYLSRNKIVNNFCNNISIEDHAMLYSLTNLAFCYSGFATFKVGDYHM